MLVNIWAAITHLSDVDFFRVSPQKPGVDLLICEGLRKLTQDRQIWAINPLYLRPGTTAALLRDSYTTLRDASESYLVLMTPGFADLMHEVPTELFRCQLREIARRSRAFNKRLITATLGTPAGAPSHIINHIAEMNDIIQSTTADWGGVTVDLRGICFARWSSSGSQPEDTSRAAGLIVEGVLRSHCASEEWRVLHGQNG